MTKKIPEMYLKASFLGLLSTAPDMPAGSVGFGKVTSTTSKKVSIEVDDAIVKIDYDGSAPTVGSTLYFDANGKLVSMVVPAVPTQARQGSSTGAAHDVRPNSLY